MKRIPKNKVIGVDVDLTVCDVVTDWIKWYKDLTGHDISDDISTTNNDLEKVMHKHSDPLSFWKKPDLYDKTQAFPDAVKVLTGLYNDGYDIIFISSCFPEHETSKRMFCQRSFPFMAGFISTSDKQFINMDYFIDDYSKYLTKVFEYNSKVKCYHIKSDINSAKRMFDYGGWNQFDRFVRRDD